MIVYVDNLKACAESEGVLKPFETYIDMDFEVNDVRVPNQSLILKSKWDFDTEVKMEKKSLTIELLNQTFMTNVKPTRISIIPVM